jgi:bacillolysin
MNPMRNIIWLAALLGLNCAHRIDPASLRLAGRQNIEITQNDKLGTPTLVRGNLADLSDINKEKRAKPLLQFIKENPQVFKLDAPDQELRLLRSEKDDLGFVHYRYERLHKGVPIYGDELILHVNDKSQLYQANGQYHASLSIATEHVITAEKAGILALEQGVAHKMKNVDKTTLVFYPAQDVLHLAWHVILSGGMNKWDYFIDAQTGAVLFDQDLRRF